jgi:arginyl-tRNA synthetase
MAIVPEIQSVVSNQVKELFGLAVEPESVLVNETKPEFEGDYTVVLFALVKTLKKSPEALGQELGQKLVAANPAFFSGFNVIKGFLNLSITENYWLQFLQQSYANASFGKKPSTGRRVMVEYSSPNTNKPLHLGHLRNNFLGWSIAAIYRANGYDVVKTAIANDRGIHICKSMIAWKMFANGATPESTGTKGDHLVGDYYVMFGNELKRQAQPLIGEIFEKNDLSRFPEFQKKQIENHLKRIKELQQADPKDPKATQEKIDAEKSEIKDIVENETPIMQAAKQMLVDWEAGNKEVVDLWRMMNNWVYQGFAVTYKRIGSDFDKTYYESDTYLLGKQMVQEGLQKKVFFQKDDGSVWIDLTADGLDEKIVQRRDGTAVYITQDIGLAELKQKEFPSEQSIYVVGDEQNYHFKVLKLICQKLGLPSADGIYHLSYGMVELPTGRMKTREGTVVDADDIIDEMVKVARQKTEELGKVKDFDLEGLNELYDTLGLGALKFFLLRVDPKKRMVFNPEESIDFHGFTGPFIQYTFARASSILRKESPAGIVRATELLPHEKNVIVELEKYPGIIEQAGAEMNPSVIAGYAFKLAQSFNSFVTELRVLTAETADKKELRLQLCQMTVNVIKSAMELLGINVPERM